MVGRPPLTPLIRTTFLAAQLAELTDGELVTRFVTTCDADAFAELVRRLGPAVYGVCRRILGSAEDAEDAFQVSFLVLARKAGGIRPPARVVAWLHGVATLTARRARAMRARRRGHESAVIPPTARSDAPEPDLGGVIDEELNRLPERLRLPIVLCEVRGLTVVQAARELGWPVGTVASRLSRGRSMLATRLAHRGLAVGAVGGAVAPPARLVASTISLTTPGGMVPSGATSSLLNEVTRAMTLTRVRLLAVGLFAAAVTGLTAGVGGLTPTTAAPVPTAAAPPEKGLDRVPLRNLPALLSSEAVQKDKDLNLSDEQRNAVKNAQAGLKKSLADAVNMAIAAGPKGGPGPGVGFTLDLDGAEEQAVKEFDKTVLDALKPEQSRRLKQISLQAMGPAALLDRRVVRELGLTAEQEDKIEAHLPSPPKPQPSIEVVGQKPVDDPKAAEKVDEAWATAVKVLSTDQRKKWERMIGKPLPTNDLRSIATWPGLWDDLDTQNLIPPPAFQPVLPPPGGGGGGKPGGGGPDR